MDAGPPRMSFVDYDERYPGVFARARALLTRPEATVSSIARLLGVSGATVYKHIPEIAATGLPPARQPRPGATVGARCAHARCYPG